MKTVSRIDAELKAHDDATIAHVQGLLDAALNEIISTLISETIDPLRTQVRELRLDLDQVRMRQADMVAIHDQQADAIGVRIGTLAREIEALKPR
jgi:hypothetical protein